MLVRIYDITKKKTVIKLLFLKCILFICFKKKKVPGTTALQYCFL